MSALRDWAKLDARWYEDPVLRAAAKQAPAAFVMWPVLVGMAKAASHVDDNPEGIVRVSMDDLAAACCVTSRRAIAAIEALVEGEFVIVEAYRVGLLSVRLKSFAKWQTPRKSKAEREANHRWRKSREKAATRDGDGTPAGQSRGGRAMPDRDEDKDVTTDSAGARDALTSLPSAVAAACEQAAVTGIRSEWWQSSIQKLRTRYRSAADEVFVGAIDWVVNESDGSILQSKRAWDMLSGAVAKRAATATATAPAEPKRRTAAELLAEQDEIWSQPA